MLLKRIWISIFFASFSFVYFFCHRVGANRWNRCSCSLFHVRYRKNLPKFYSSNLTIVHCSVDWIWIGSKWIVVMFRSECASGKNQMLLIFAFASILLHRRFSNVFNIVHVHNREKLTGCDYKFFPHFEEEDTTKKSTATTAICQDQRMECARGIANGNWYSVIHSFTYNIQVALANNLSIMS